MSRSGSTARASPSPRMAAAARCGACIRCSARPAKIVTQWLELPDGERFFSIARTVTAGGGGYGRPRVDRAIALACAAEHAPQAGLCRGRRSGGGGGHADRRDLPPVPPQRNALPAPCRRSAARSCPTTTAARPSRLPLPRADDQGHEAWHPIDTAYPAMAARPVAAHHPATRAQWTGLDRRRAGGRHSPLPPALRSRWRADLTAHAEALRHPWTRLPRRRAAYRGRADRRSCSPMSRGAIRRSIARICSISRCVLAAHAGDSEPTRFDMRVADRLDERTTAILRRTARSACAGSSTARRSAEMGTTPAAICASYRNGSTTCRRAMPSARPCCAAPYSFRADGSSIRLPA